MRRSASLSLGFTPRSLGRSLIFPPGPAGMLAWPPAFLMWGYNSAFRVWRILGGGKIRQTLCVLFLACPPRFDLRSKSGEGKNPE